MALEASVIRTRKFERATHPLLRIPETISVLANRDFGGIRWGDQTYYPRHEKFTADLVGFAESGELVHIEQETSLRNDLSIRMMEYGTLLAVAHDLTPRLFQMVYYTGDTEQSSGWREFPLGMTHFEYLFVDAGSVETCGELLRASLETAPLALLVRDHNRFLQFADTLIHRIYAIPSEKRFGLIETCMRVAELRRRKATFRGMLMGASEYDASLFMVPEADDRVRETLLTCLDKIFSSLPFEVSEELKEYFMHEAGGWELQQFVIHQDEFATEADIHKFFELSPIPESQTPSVG